VKTSNPFAILLTEATETNDIKSGHTIKTYVPKPAI
jgi:hypothetical protein